MTSRQTDPELYISQYSIIRASKRNIHLIDIRMENAVDEAYAWALVGVLIWKLYMHFPKTTLERCYKGESRKPASGEPEQDTSRTYFLQVP